MNILKIIGIGIGAIVALAVAGFVTLLAMMIISSKRGYAKIEKLKNEFTIGTSVDTLIDRSDELRMGSLFWNDGDKKYHYDSAFLAGEGINFADVKANFQKLNSGAITLIAYGALPLERFILSITFENRKIVSTDYRIVD